ncbi:MAG: ferritin family protein [Desulfobacteraceae bacterium]|nr:ferritin family protein [Desulfobacteraceae bacterium]
MFTTDDIFEIAIKMEENGEAIYNDAIKKIERNEIKSLLKWMANEEACHGEWFTNQKNSLCLEIDEINLKKMAPQVLQDMMKEKALSLEDINFNDIKNVAELLGTFIGFEEDTIMFYELLEMFINEDKVLKELGNIIQEEKKHIEKLQTMMESLQKESF